jgi:hypothetical protein
LANFFRQLPLLFVGHAEGGAFVQFLLDGSDHRGMTMPGHQGAKAQVVIDVFVSVNVVNAAALPFLHEDGIRLVVAIVAGYAQRNSFRCAFVRGRGFRGALFVRGDFFLQLLVHGTSP